MFHPLPYCQEVHGQTDLILKHFLTLYWEVLLFCFVFLGSLWRQNLSVDQDSFKFTILLSQPPEWWRTGMQHVHGLPLLSLSSLCCVEFWRLPRILFDAIQCENPYSLTNSQLYSVCEFALELLILMKMSLIGAYWGARSPCYNLFLLRDFGSVWVCTCSVTRYCYTGLRQMQEESAHGLQ